MNGIMQSGVLVSDDTGVIAGGFMATIFPGRGPGTVQDLLPSEIPGSCTAHLSPLSAYY